jgi:hypothetical protein
MKLLPPNELFELQATWTARLRAPDSSVSEPLGTQTTIARFHTSGPPAYADALTAYVASCYPFDGARPVYLGYDLSVRFHEDYVPHLYAGVGERLVIRLFDGQGQPVLNHAGEAFLIPASSVGPVSQSVAEQYWEEIYQQNVASGCISPVGSISHEGETGLTASGSEFSLTPNSQYVAHLVSDARPDVPLLRWGFTTSRFTTFTAMTTMDRSVAAARVAATTLPVGGDFDAIARAAGLPTIGYVDTFRVMPVLAPGGASCVALLFEAPEPLELESRLSVTVDGGATIGVVNHDGTRAVFRPQGVGAWALGTLAVRLTWLRSASPALTVDGDASPEVVTFDVVLGASP